MALSQIEHSSMVVPIKAEEKTTVVDVTMIHKTMPRCTSAHRNGSEAEMVAQVADKVEEIAV